MISSTRNLVVVLTSLLAVLILLAGGLMFRVGQRPSAPTPAPTPSPVTPPSPSPEPSPMPSPVNPPPPPAAQYPMPSPVSPPPPPAVQYPMPSPSAMSSPGNRAPSSHVPSPGNPPPPSPAQSPPSIAVPTIPAPISGPPPNSVELMDQILRELNWGNIAFNAPTTMRYAQSQSVELLLSPALSVEDLQAKLHQKAGAESAHVRVSNRMEAQLTGTGFTIQALRPDLQAVTSEQITRWKWEVTPTEQGRQTLHLTLAARIDLAGRDTPLVVRTFHREIQVVITVPQRVSGFIQGNWQWLWATLVVPIAGYLWSRKKKRGAKPKAKPKAKRSAP